MIVPFPSVWHAPFIQAAADRCGLGWQVAADSDASVAARGLALVNNDACYDTLVAAAQAVAAAEAAGRRGADEPAAAEVGLPLLCNRCRSLDKPYLVQEALCRAGFGQVRVLPLFQAMGEPGFASPEAQRCLAAAIAVADGLLQVRLRVRPHLPASRLAYFDAVVESWRERVLDEVASPHVPDALDLVRSLDAEAGRLFGVGRTLRPIVGVAGSAAVLFNPMVNGGLADTLEAEGCEVRLPWLASILAFVLAAQGVECSFSGELDRLCLQASQGFAVIPGASCIGNLQEVGSRFAPAPLARGLGCAVAGWMQQLLWQGIDDIVYASHFGCLSGHVSGAGILGPLRRAYPQANIAAVEYDPGTSSLNQVNRLRLMASIAWQKKEGVRQ